ncbi:flagellar hook-associated protein FlgK [Vallitalea sp.]|jgi:flagellar hook-associated protein 1 FlgK|uniref:flagellar hook-associated protein FlgK n=1 Tax=Vallitalea sp. TaxID=1882829 RepID=UPI0025F2B7F6|nr:flagellar hook-associated protein FlgK [Vallitalea sp.]MCT4687970.1 flagellar hook-associated protein FlgK [Vallitalea sp.]
MRSSFFGLNVATQGLYTARTWLDITNHNITNAQTPGYSRQYGVQSACRPLPNNGIGMMGTGSEILKISRYRNHYLDVKFWSNSSHLGEYRVKNSQTSSVETILNEIKKTGITKQFDDMFKSLQKLSTDPSNKSYKIGFIDMAKSFSRYFNDIGEKMRSLQREANYSIKSKVDQINYCANQIATLNKQIENVEFSGVEANDLRDKRANIVDELSQIINVKVDEHIDANGKKTFSILANGQKLLEGTKVNLLKTKSRKNLNNPEDEPGLYDIYWENGNKFDMTDPELEGELKGYIDMRDGNNGNNFKGQIDNSNGKVIEVIGFNRTDLPDKGKIKIDNIEYEYESYNYNESSGKLTFTLKTVVPASAANVSMGENLSYKGISYYVDRMNNFVRTVAKKFNDIHKKGNGAPLFTYDGYTSGDIDYSKMTIDNFQFSKEIAKDVDKLITSYKKESGESDSSIIKELLALKHDSKMFKTGEPGNYIQAVIGELGIDKSQADSFEKSQLALNKMIDNQRISYSGVDINEEATNIVKFQQAYVISAKMIKVFDEIFDVTINRMGAN